MTASMNSSQDEADEATETRGEQGDETTVTLLGNSTNREIIRATRESPQSASELETRCDASLSSIYRKIDSLLKAGLLEDRIRITETGKHTTEYVSRVERVELSLSQSGAFSVTVDKSTGGHSGESPERLSIYHLSGGKPETASSQQQSPVRTQND